MVVFLSFVPWFVVFRQAKLQEEPSDTPLQEKLDAMAAMIGYVGMACAAATFVATMCVYFTTHRVSEGWLGRACLRFASAL